MRSTTDKIPAPQHRRCRATGSAPIFVSVHTDTYRFSAVAPLHLHENEHFPYRDQSQQNPQLPHVQNIYPNEHRMNETRE
jgi:hypothetical protein